MRGTSKLCYYYQCGWSIGPHRVCTSVIKRKKKEKKKIKDIGLSTHRQNQVFSFLLCKHQVVCLSMSFLVK